VLDEKARIRRESFLRRDRLSPLVRELTSHQIHERLCAMPEYRDAERVMLYASVGSEVVTWGIALEVLARGSRTYYPRVERGEIEPYEVASPAPDLLPRGKYRIPEPHPERCRRADAGEVDLVLVPGAAFDVSGHRLGYGKGYYDRFLGRIRPGVPSLGLAYDISVSRRLPVSPWDRAVEAVVTEKRTYRERREEWRTRGPDETVLLGRSLGRALLERQVPGEPVTIGLSGPLGAGKTCLVRGLAAGLGSPDEVSSPTFTIENVYRGGPVPLRHLDLYRLPADPGEEDAGLFEEHFSEAGVSVIEWAERWTDLLPLDTISIELGMEEDGSRAVGIVSRVESQHPVVDGMVETLKSEGIRPC
jgi:5-formyltetrahydrofolate cyclo-ligase